MITDYDAGVDSRDAMTAEVVMRIFYENIERLRELILAVVPKIGPQPQDVCATALTGSRL